MTAPFPPDDVLRDAVSRAGNGRCTRLERRPLSYATSFPIDHTTVAFDDGSTAELAVKDLRWSSLLGDAATTKPEHLHSPARSIGVHRRVLAPAELGARWWAAGSGAPPDGEWLAIELVDGNPLWEIGDVAAWEAVTVWLADLHQRTSPDLDTIRRAVPEVIEYSPAWMEPWLARARSALRDGDDPRHNAAIERLDQLSTAAADPARSSCLVHGEFYPSNVIVSRDGRICPIDWELAGIGDPMIDLAALITGWDLDTAERLVAAYADRLGVAADDPALRRRLGHWQAMNAARWIGWSTGWRPPVAHDHDWIRDLVE